jgi:hypothetical protein
MSVVDRLGREQIDTTYLLKQIIAAGVPVFDYLSTFGPCLLCWVYLGKHLQTGR